MNKYEVGRMQIPFLVTMEKRLLLIHTLSNEHKKEG